jgi:hypothetical protein
MDRLWGHFMEVMGVELQSVANFPMRQVVTVIKEVVILVLGVRSVMKLLSYGHVHVIG